MLERVSKGKSTLKVIRLDKIVRNGGVGLNEV